MIKKSVFENDLIAGMQRELQSHDKKVAMANLDKAGGYLLAALEIFEEAGLNAQAEKVLSILEKIAVTSKTRPVEEVPNLQVFFDSGKFTPEDMKKAMGGDTEALAKINVGLHEHGLSDHKVAKFMGKNYIPYQMAKKMLEEGHLSGLRALLQPSVPAPASKEMGDQEIGTRNASDDQDARGKPNKPKNPTKVHDPHIPKSTEQAVRGLKEYGIPFVNLSDDGKADTLLEVELSDDNNLEEVAHDPADKSFEDES